MARGAVGWWRPRPGGEGRRRGWVKALRGCGRPQVGKRSRVRGGRGCVVLDKGVGAQLHPYFTGGCTAKPLNRKSTLIFGNMSVYI